MRFETEQDLINERAAVERFAAVFKCDKIEKLGANDVDFLLYRSGAPVGFVEVKCYTAKSDQFDKQIISLQKIAKLSQVNHKKTAILLCKYSDDVILWIKVLDIKGFCKLSGRKPRAGSSNDQELCLFIDKKLFNKLD